MLGKENRSASDPVRTNSKKESQAQTQRRRRRRRSRRSMMMTTRTRTRKSLRPRLRFLDRSAKTATRQMMQRSQRRPRPRPACSTRAHRPSTLARSWSCPARELGGMENVISRSQHTHTSRHTRSTHGNHQCEEKTLKQGTTCSTTNRCAVEEISPVNLVVVPRASQHVAVGIRQLAYAHKCKCKRDTDCERRRIHNRSANTQARSQRPVQLDLGRACCCAKSSRRTRRRSHRTGTSLSRVSRR